MLSAQVSARRTCFDDYFYDVTFVERRDWTYTDALSASFRVSMSTNLAAEVTYTKRDSSFFLSAYDGFEGRAGAGLGVRF